MHWLRFYGPSVQLLPLTYHLPLRHFLSTFFQRMNNLEKNKSTQEQKKMMKVIITETKDRTHKQSMRFFCLLFYRKPTLSEVCWASRTPVTSPETHTRFAVDIPLTANCRSQTAGRYPVCIRPSSDIQKYHTWERPRSDIWWLTDG